MCAGLCICIRILMLALDAVGSMVANANTSCLALPLVLGPKPWCKFLANASKVGSHEVCLSPINGRQAGGKYTHDA